jgi:hypothetical protein
VAKVRTRETSVSQQRPDVVDLIHDSSDDEEDENVSPSAPPSSPIKSARNVRPNTRHREGSRENIPDSLGEQQPEQSSNMVTQSDISGSDSESLLNTTEEMNYVKYIIS